MDNYTQLHDSYNTTCYRNIVCSTYIYLTTPCTKVVVVVVVISTENTEIQFAQNCPVSKLPRSGLSRYHCTDQPVYTLPKPVQTLRK